MDENEKAQAVLDGLTNTFRVGDRVQDPTLFTMRDRIPNGVIIEDLRGKYNNSYFEQFAFEVRWEDEIGTFYREIDLQFLRHVRD